MRRRGAAFGRRGQMILDGEYSMRGIRVISLMNGRHFLYEIVKLYSNEP